MIKNVLVSSFPNTRNTETTKEDRSVGDWLVRVANGAFKTQINALRAGDLEVKKKIPTVAFHGQFDKFRQKKNFVYASGLIILDIDDVEDDLEEVKSDIMEESDSVLAAMISPSGNGIKVLYYVEPSLVNAENYRDIGKAVIDEFSIYGHADYLSITDCLIMTYDPKIKINWDATPAYVHVQSHIKVEKELDPVDQDRVLWDDPEDFFDTVLAEDIASKTNNNFHYIQVAVLDMKKFGFVHPAEDLSFIIDYAESHFKSSGENKGRFLEVVEVAKQYPQTQWPYKMISSEDPDDEYVDYSAFQDEDAVKRDPSDSTEVETDGLIDYSNFFDRVIEVVKEGDRVGFEVSLKDFADVFRFKGSGILTFTGIPGHGKTEFVDQVIVDLARKFGHQSFIVGFEQTPEEHTIKLMRRILGVNVTCPSWYHEENQGAFKKAYDWVTNKIKHVDSTTVGGNINDILTVCAEGIKRSRDEGGDPRYVVIDPFNMLSVKGKFSGHEKVEEILRRITHFSHQMDVIVILVAHPFKMRKDEKTEEYHVPDFYSVKGSSAFFEMSYHGLVIYRRENEVMVKVLKVKHNNLGSTGAEVFFMYDRESGRYIPIDNEGNEQAGDHREKDWLDKAI
jgi:hypothetical protein